ncbi:hypothetical protein C8J57DRAFT_1290710 [Mycena rebaudengoi]|nr:hypothetical protein C8J57DRAFT_1290710 [Mycena rebaudengoi]
MADFVERIAQTLNSMDPTVTTPSYGSGNTGGLPAYSRRESINPPAPAQLATEHQYHLSSRGSKPMTWATLKVLSRSPTPGHIPTFLQGDKIGGFFSVNLGRKDSIVSIHVTAKGQIMPGPVDSEALTFVEVGATLWSKDTGEFRTGSSSSMEHKLSGQHVWPFTLELPAAVTLPATRYSSAGTFALPQTFLERRVQTSVQYSLLVSIIRSRFRVNSKIETTFSYIPSTRPPPPSPLRQLAYRENRPLLGPEVDLDGWAQLPPFTVRGTVFSSRNAEATCNLSLAIPLCYTRGSPIPCSLTIFSNDSQALDLLSSPRAVEVHLRRRVRPCTPASKRSGMFDANADLSVDPVEDIAAASWWPTQDHAQGTQHGVRRRRLEGEIQLPANLKPSCQIAHFAVEYTVEVLPFKAIAFVSVDDTGQPLLSQRVEVTTMFARDCPRPRTFAAPQYNANTTRGSQDNSYFNADGLGHVCRT